ncbi:MAG: metallophosphoesterase [Anaerolineales bacterium]|nr:metallophosphoesterase [Anaerolineales bacterium]
MKILSLSDKTVSFIYSTQARERFGKVDLLLGCGDLPYTYLEYVLTVLNAPLFFVRGNHDKLIEYGAGVTRQGPQGGMDLHLQTCNYNGLLLAGVEGSLRYRDGKFQYTQEEMWNFVLRLVPSLALNRLRYGRYLDIFVTHAPPAGIHDQPDLPHQGIEAFLWLIKVFQPAYHFHGHVHVYHPDTVIETVVGRTQVINTYGYRETETEAFGGL